MIQTLYLRLIKPMIPWPKVRVGSMKLCLLSLVGKLLDLTSFATSSFFLGSVIIEASERGDRLLLGSEKDILVLVRV